MPWFLRIYYDSKAFSKHAKRRKKTVNVLKMHELNTQVSKMPKVRYGK